MAIRYCAKCNAIRGTRRCWKCEQETERQRPPYTYRAPEKPVRRLDSIGIGRGRLAGISLMSIAAALAAPFRTRP